MTKPHYIALCLMTYNGAHYANAVYSRVICAQTLYSHFTHILCLRVTNIRFGRGSVHNLKTCCRILRKLLIRLFGTPANGNSTTFNI